MTPGDLIFGGLALFGILLCLGKYLNKRDMENGKCDL